MRAISLFIFLFALALPAFAGESRTASIQKAYAESSEDADPVVRQAAAKSMGETGDKGYVELLTVMATRDEDDGVRVASIGALSAIGERSSLPVYEKALSDGSDKVRRSAAEALNGRWEEGAQKALIQTLRNDKSPKVRQSAAEALGRPAMAGKLKANHLDANDEAEAALIQTIKQDESYEVRATAAETLGKFKSGKSLQPLIDSLDDKNASVRAAAAASLGMLDNPSAVGRLLDVLSFERDDTVIVNALRSLKYSQDQRLTEPVIRLLRSGSARVRWQAIDVLESLRPQEGIDPLKGIADDRFESEGVKAKAHEALQLMGAE